MNNNNEPLQELPDADYKEWMITKAFKRIMDDYYGSYQAEPLTIKTFITILREIKYNGRTNTN